MAEGHNALEIERHARLPLVQHDWGSSICISTGLLFASRTAADCAINWSTCCRALLPSLARSASILEISCHDRRRARHEDRG